MSECYLNNNAAPPKYTRTDSYILGYVPKLTVKSVDSDFYTLMKCRNNLNLIIDNTYIIYSGRVLYLTFTLYKYSLEKNIRSSLYWANIYIDTQAVTLSVTNNYIWSHYLNEGIAQKWEYTTAIPSKRGFTHDDYSAHYVVSANNAMVTREHVNTDITVTCYPNWDADYYTHSYTTTRATVNLDVTLNGRLENIIYKSFG